MYTEQAIYGIGVTLKLMNIFYISDKDKQVT